MLLQDQSFKSTEIYYISADLMIQMEGFNLEWNLPKNTKKNINQV
jgi:hypothetical protein